MFCKEKNVKNSHLTFSVNRLFPLKILFPGGEDHGDFLVFLIPLAFTLKQKHSFLFLPSSPHYLRILNFFMCSGMFGTSEPSMIIVITLSCVHIYHRGHWKCLRAGFWGSLNTFVLISEPSCLVTEDILTSACTVPQSALLFREPRMCGGACLVEGWRGFGL